MKLDLSNPITNTTSLKTTEYSININATTFELLFKKLYSNPINSIVRELVSNARDAQIEAGTKDIPIQINLPTALEPEFIVKDFGTGLSPEQMIEIYTVGFCSTKQNSNDYLGCYGLGSKSPLSYTDQYIVESRYQGMKRTYLIFINERNIPSLSEPIEEIHTDEHNGLTIRMNVNQNDRYKFTAAAAETLLFFNTNLPKPELTTVYEGPLFTIYKTLPQLPQHLYAKIGSVLYPIDLNTLDIEYRRYEEKHYTTILNIPIGALSITPNRENLNYDEKTINYLNKRINKATEYFHTKITNLIRLTKNENEATKNTLSLRAILTKLNGILKDQAFFFPGSSNPLDDKYIYTPCDNTTTFYKFTRTRRKRAGEFHPPSEHYYFRANAPYILVTATTKTPYIKDWVKENIDGNCVLIKANDTLKEEEHITQFLTSINSTCYIRQVTKIQIRKPYTKQDRVKLLRNSDTYKFIDETDTRYYLLQKDSYEYKHIKSPSYLSSFINLLYNAKLIEFRDVIDLPPSNTSYIKRYELINARPIIDLALPDWVELHKKELIYAQVFNELKYDTLNLHLLRNIPLTHPLGETVHSLLKGANIRDTLYMLQLSTNLTIPTPTTETKDALKLLETYEVLMYPHSHQNLNRLLSLVDQEINNV